MVWVVKPVRYTARGTGSLGSWLVHDVSVMVWFLVVLVFGSFSASDLKLNSLERVTLVLIVI